MKGPFAAVQSWFDYLSKDAVSQGPAIVGGRHHSQALSGMEERLGA